MDVYPLFGLSETKGKPFILEDQIPFIAIAWFYHCFFCGFERTRVKPQSRVFSLGGSASKCNVRHVGLSDAPGVMWLCVPLLDTLWVNDPL